MRYLILAILFIEFANQLNAQTLSSQSQATQFNIPLGSKTFSEVSKPIELKVRQDQVFYNVSPPTHFVIGKITNNSTLPNDLPKPISATETKSIPELENASPKYYSLIIGVNDYQFNNERLQDLGKAIKDASTLHETLIQDFSFQSEYSVLLLNPNRQEVIKQLESLASTITSKDNLLIFYAGHGVWDEKIKVGYWLPSDAQTDDKSSWISNSTIRDYIAGIISKHTLLISDACFSGSILKTRDISLSDYGMSNLYRLSSRKAMTSGTLTTVPDESKFMEYFIKRLKDTEGKYISARQIFYGLESAVINNTNSVPQFGVIQDTGDEGGDFIFLKRSKND